MQRDIRLRKPDTMNFRFGSWFLASASVLVLGCGDDSSSAGGAGAAGGAGGAGAGAPADVNFHEHVEPILQRSCLGCHLDGKIGGFSMLTYDEAKPLAAAIAAATGDKRMPPWGAQTTDECQPRFAYKNDISLSDDEIAILRAWSDAGAPKGDEADAPPPYEPLPDGLPGMDVALTPAEPGVVDGDSDLFECVIYDPALTEERWVDGVHLLPGNPKVAHHALTFRAPREDALALSGGGDRFPCFGGSPGQLVHVWAPGGMPYELPDDVGIRVKPTDVFVVQMHYHPTGAGPEEDLSELELRFTDEVPAYQFVVALPGNASSGGDGLMPGPNDSSGSPEFRIPAGAEDHTEVMEVLVPPEIFIDVPILMVATHMHYVGTDIKLEIERAGSASQPPEECLLHTPAWDFNWQRMYTFDTPIAELPTGRGGDVLRITCHYNNSMSNPFVVKALGEQGMSAPVDVFLGEQTLDEMCLAPLGILAPSSIDI